MSDRVIGQFISEARKALAEMAEDSMTYPRPDPFEHGVSCGRHQGIQLALDILSSVISGDQEANNKL